MRYENERGLDMPEINKTIFLRVTVEQFLDACKPSELAELEFLLSKDIYQRKIFDQKHSDLYQQAQNEEGKERRLPG